MSVLTLVDAKAHLNITVSTYDTELQAVIDSAEAAIVKRCGPLTSTAITATRVDGYGCQLVLPITPAISVTSVTANTGGTVVVSDLSVTPSGIVEYTTGVGYFTAPWYTVVYQAGRASVPADLLFGVKEQVKHLWASQRGPVTRPGQGSASDQLVFSAQINAFPRNVLELIAPHEQPSFA